MPGRSSTSYVSNALFDLDLDGRNELVRLELNFSLFELIKLLLSSEVDIDLSILRWDPEKGFSDKPWMKKARTEQVRTKETATRFTECEYAARSWGRERRIVIKAEVTVIEGREPRDNCRYVVTNLRHSPERLYQLYRQRGDVENRIKELNHGVDIGRTSCSSFLANSFRVQLAAAAYMLMQVLRELTDDPDLRRAQVWTLRERLLKVAARVRITHRCLHIALPETYVWARAFRRLAIAMRARPAPT